MYRSKNNVQRLWRKTEEMIKSFKKKKEAQELLTQLLGVCLWVMLLHTIKVGISFEAATLVGIASIAAKVRA